MAEIGLVTGGCRSGKSSYALKRAEALGSRSRCYIATAPRCDEEMERRIDCHVRERGESWTTVEEEVELVKAIERSAEFDVLLVDCLALWVNNLLHSCPDRRAGEEFMASRMEAVLRAARQVRGSIVFVTNEVGQGIVPADQQVRIYRDALGRCNQLAARAADWVVLMVCGLSQPIKGG